MSIKKHYILFEVYFKSEKVRVAVLSSPIIFQALTDTSINFLHTEIKMCCVYMQFTQLSIPGDEAPKWPSPIIFQAWTDTRTFSNLKFFAHGDKNVLCLHVVHLTVHSTVQF